MSHRLTLPVTFLALLALGGATAAQADALADCRHAADAAARLAACSEVIAGKSYGPADKAIAYRNRGRARVAAGALADAVADLDQAVRLNANDTQSYLYRAQARLAGNDTVGAIADYAAVIRLKPNWAIGYIGRGHAQLVSGKANEAVADFSEAIRINPQSASAHNNRGLAWKKAGSNDKALEDFTTAVTLNPIYALAYVNRGYTFEQLGRKDAAVADYRRALLLNSSLAGAKEGLSRLGAFGALATESQRLVTEGQALVETHCSACHAVGTTGASPNAKAPPFRTLHQRHPMMDMREPLTRSIAAPHDQMPKFRLSDEQTDRIVAYINSLDR